MLALIYYTPCTMPSSHAMTIHSDRSASIYQLRISGEFFVCPEHLQLFGPSTKDQFHAPVSPHGEDDEETKACIAAIDKRPHSQGRASVAEDPIAKGNNIGLEQH